MSPQVLAWMSAIQGLMAIAPDVILFAADVKSWIANMFSRGLISAEVQNALNGRVNDICGAFLTGKVPTAWQVEEDPK